MKKILLFLLPLLALAACTKDADTQPTAPQVVRILAYGPMNEMIWWEDSLARPVAIFSRASECDPQVITLHYGSDGRIASVNETVYADFDDAYVENLDSLLEVYLNNRPDYQVFAQNEFEYRADGALVAIKSTCHYEEGEVDTSIVSAAEGYHLQAVLRPVMSYWCSDLRGGEMVLCVEEVADSTGKNDGNGRQWILAGNIDNDDWDDYFNGKIDEYSVFEEHDHYPKTIHL